MKFARRKRSTPVITIVSLIDILTILLIFFIVTTTFKTQQPQVEINLPEVKSAVETPSKEAPAILSINQSGDIFLDNEPVLLENLGTAFKKLQETKPHLALKADEKAAYGRVLAVLDALRLAGVKDLPAFTREEKSVK